MLSEMIWTTIRRHIVAEVPDEMAACLDCGAVQCPNDRYETCPDRLAHSAALSAARTAEPVGLPNRTAEHERSS